ncbi:MAG TPA: hypothetical protein DCK98_01405 [Chloroflexi bacterium]|nr:hypothetical protein [Chloroflexota bacterium]
MIELQDERWKPTVALFARPIAKRENEVAPPDLSLALGNATTGVGQRAVRAAPGLPFGLQ